MSMRTLGSVEAAGAIEYPQRLSTLVPPNSREKPLIQPDMILCLRGLNDGQRLDCEDFLIGCFRWIPSLGDATGSPVPQNPNGFG